LPNWADRIGSKTLLLIDEAGMADTPTLDTAIGHILRHGGRVCLVGDDQQLSAIGAGGILTDLQNTYGAVRLTQLHRFADPDEAAATLQVRNGDPDAIDFYTHRERIKIADPSGVSDRLLAAWRHDQRQGLDSLMLAPSRRQVADLNQRARDNRLAGHQPKAEVDLADGNRASVGDLIITRRNDRRLTAGRDWVRNGDRWTITAITADGGLRAVHRRTGKPVTLPSGYVREAVELGYATTIHTAQGVTADTTHGLVDELMTREQLYTMVSRGRTANHLYLPVGGDGDPHGILHTDPGELTAADLLERVLFRSSLAASATTIRRQEHSAAELRRRLHTPRPSHEQSYGPAPVPRGPAAPGW
jgi:ATP-dependent exoDNAse (exonuclease V) alpha subunit